MRRERRKLSSKTALAEAMDYSLKRWTALTRFLDDGRICLSNNAAERAVRGIAVGRRNWTFAGSDSGGRRAAGHHLERVQHPRKYVQAHLDAGGFRGVGERSAVVEQGFVSTHLQIDRRQALQIGKDRAGEWMPGIGPCKDLRYLQDFLVEDRLISPVGDHLTGSLAEPKGTSLTLPSSYWQVCGL